MSHFLRLKGSPTRSRAPNVFSSRSSFQVLFLKHPFSLASSPVIPAVLQSPSIDRVLHTGIAQVVSCLMGCVDYTI